jgi:hypothetical protein
MTWVPELDPARVDADEGELAEERVRGETLKARAENGSSTRRLALDVLVLVARGVKPFDGGHVERARQVVDDGVEHRLDALVLEGRATQHRVERGRDRQLADAGLDLVNGELPPRGTSP